MKIKNIAAVLAAIGVTVTMTGCAAAGGGSADGIPPDGVTDTEIQLPQPENPEVPEIPEIPETPETPETPDVPTVSIPQPEPPPVKNTVSYISVKADGVNLRAGAGTGFKALGTAEKSTLYALLGEENGWYKTYYKNRTVYLSKKYCVLLDMEKSGDDMVEAVIAEGTKFMGVPYVYGAVRVHDGYGNLLKGFSLNAFDCSSLMQYMFYKGADRLLQVTTRTQVKQGTTVSKSKLKRGDLMFFTNSSRKNNTGIERIGHVAMYLGDNYILHTASDYAKIEQISSTRWSYYIQSQRMI